MTTQPPRSYTALSIAIVVAALVIGASIVATSFPRSTTTLTTVSTATTTVYQSSGGSTTTSTLCFQSGIHGSLYVRVLADVTGQPVAGANVSATITNYCTPNYHVDWGPTNSTGYASGGIGWTGDYIVSVVYAGTNYTFPAQTSAGVSLVTLGVPSGVAVEETVACSVLGCGNATTTATATRTFGETNNTSSTTISGSTTLPPISWSYQGLASAVTNSSEVKPHVTDAYYYFVMRYGAAPGNGTQLFADVYVVGAQTVAGNWTTGYNVTYTGRQIFNATVQYTEPSTYKVTGTTVTNLADQTYSISFDATQKQAIGVALANSTVKADIGGMAYFVTFADSQVNGTLGYWVQMSQVDGYRSLGALVNSDLTEVSEVVASTSYPNLGAP